MNKRPPRKPLAKNTSEDLALLEEVGTDFLQAPVDFVYGFPCTNDPRDFLPDIETSTPREIERWAADYRKAIAGIENDPAMPYSLSDSEGNETVHIVPSTWGMGTTRYLAEDEAPE